jgi:hypothetical protein
MNPILSVIIVNYNGLNFVRHCLRSVLQSKYPYFEVLFVDNASNDGSLELVEKLFAHDSRLKIIKNPKNLGLGAGNNIGAKHAKGRYLLFLDNDTEIDANCIGEIVKVLDSNPQIGAGQCKLLRMSEKSRYQSAGIFIDSFGLGHIRGSGEVDKGQYDFISSIFSAVGAALFIRAALFKELGGFDEDFFIFEEEVDLCWRVWLHGYKVVFAPKAIVYHSIGGASSKLAKTRNVYLTYRNWIMSKIKNYGISNLFHCLPIYIVFLIAYGIVSMKRSYLGSIISAILYNIIHLRKIWRKRLNVQKARRISDKKLMQEGVILKFNTSEALKYLRRTLLGFT